MAVECQPTRSGRAETRPPHSWGSPREGCSRVPSSACTPPEGDVRPRPARAHPSPASYPGPTGPALRANPFPEVTDPICRLPLPTLFYRLEAVHLGDLLRIWVRRSARFHRSASLGFSRAGDRTRDSARAAELCGNIAVAPSLGANPFQAACDLTKKRELFPGLTTTSPRSLALPRLEGETPTTVSAATLRNIDRIPFRSFRGHVIQGEKKSPAPSEWRSPMT